MMAPKAQIILEYKQFYSEDPPENRISIIKDYCKHSILFEIVTLNYRLKPKNQFFIDSSLEFQIKELKYFTKTDDIFNKYARIASRHSKSEKEYALLFNRQACLFAIEELVNSDEINLIEDFKMDINVWESIIKYLLAVNSEIIKSKSIESSAKVDFEYFSSQHISLNELAVEIDPVHTLYRGYELIRFLENHEIFKDWIKEYFNERYSIKPFQFIYFLLNLYLSNSAKKDEFRFFYLITEADQQLLDSLSIRVPIKETHKLISIRKSPFINGAKNQYLLSDTMLLLEKCYSQLINDFWFDFIKPKNIVKIDTYKGAIGYFFEEYVSKWFNQSLALQKHSKTLLFNQLIVTDRRGQTSEVADIYFRYGNKIMLGEVKSGAIDDNQKYGGDLESFYKKGREKFFANFGVDQIVKAISNLDDNILQLDDKYPINHTRYIYPVILVNDRVFQTPFMAHLFNLRFQELIDLNCLKKAIIRPLTLIHISELELIEKTLELKPNLIWELLNRHNKQKMFTNPFIYSIYKYSDEIVFSEHVDRIYSVLTATYSGVK